MVKSLILALTIAAWVCFAVNASAGPACLPVPNCWTPMGPKYAAPKPPKQITESKTFTKRVATETLIARGKCGGRLIGAGPCGAPASFKWSCAWKATAIGPGVDAVYVETKKAKLVRVKTCADDEEASPRPVRSR